MTYDNPTVKISTFWLLQTFWWVIYWIFNLFVVHYQFLDTSPKVFVWLFFVYFFGFPLSLVLRYVYKKIDYKSHSLPTISLIIVVSSILAGHIWFGYDQLLDIIFETEDSTAAKITLRLYFLITYSFTLILIVWSTLYFLVKFWHEWNQQRIRLEKADAMAQAAQLKMLRYQLNPHFLFNSLNTVRALIEENKHNAKLLISDLIEFLQYPLNIKDYSNVPLVEEIKAIQYYLAIEKKRFEEKLDVQFEIDSEAEKCRVISFLLHPLVENALKYGLQTSHVPLKILIKATVSNGILAIEIFNSGKWMKPSQIGRKNRIIIGSGLDNVRQRLENAFYHNQRLFVFRKEDGVFVRIEIKII